jgi:hypothetical protein
MSTTLNTSLNTTLDNALDTTAVPVELHPVLDAYRTCELATIAKDGTPIAWPVMAVRDPGTERFTVTTSIGFPTKAFNVRRDPHVSMLFSEPSGSGLDRPPRVLVQGTATCSDEIVTDPADLADYWRTLYTRQPAGSLYGRTALTRRFFDWYYFRLVVSVTPRRVTVEDPAIPSAVTPSAAGHGLAAVDPVVRAMGHSMGFPAGSTAFADASRCVGRYPSAVLTGLDADGFPRSTRVRPAASGGSFALPSSTGLQEGPASLLCHRHDERTWRLSSVVVVGDLRERGGHLFFDVRRVVPGASANPVRLAAMMRDARRTAGRYLARRGLERPSVPWSSYARLSDASPTRQPQGVLVGVSDTE